MEARRTDQCDGLHAAIRNLPVVLGACRPCLVEALSLPEGAGDYSQGNILCMFTFTYSQ